MPGRIRKLGAALVVAALTAGLLGAGTTSAHDKKLYTVSASPTSLVGGIATPVEITLTNTTDNQEDSDLKIAAARIDAPAGLTISHVSATYRTVAGPQPWPATWAFSYNFNTRRAELTGMRVRSLVHRGHVHRFGLPGGSYQWATEWQQQHLQRHHQQFKLVGSNPANVILRRMRAASGSWASPPTPSQPGHHHHPTEVRPPARCRCRRRPVTAAPCRPGHSRSRSGSSVAMPPRHSPAALPPPPFPVQPASLPRSTWRATARTG
jgi:hypothetical protein